MMNLFRMGIIFLINILLYSMAQTQTNASADLRLLLHSEKEWVKVHVAEFLIWEKQCVDEVREVFLEEEQQFHNLPKYRIGIWRALAQAAVDEKERQYWIGKIVTAYQNPEGEDRLHAIETLAKLKVPIIQSIDNSLEGSMRLYTMWNYALESEQAKQEVKHKLIQDLVNSKLTELEMYVTSYILRYIGPLTDNEYMNVEGWMKKEDLTAALRSNLLATLLISGQESQHVNVMKALKKELLILRKNREALPHIMIALAQKGDFNDREIISDLYDAMRDANRPDYNSDLHATAAYMMLKVEKVK